jgi:hypothetical protein
MKGRMVLAVLVMAATAWLSYTVASRSGHRSAIAEPVVDPEAAAPEPPVPATGPKLESLQLAPRPHDVVDPDPKGGIHVCETIATEDVPDALLGRTRFESRAALASFLQKNAVGYNAIRRQLIPDFVKATRAIKTCYRGAGDQQGVAYLGIHIRATRDRAAVVDASLLRVDAPTELQARLQDCLASFKATSLPIAVEAPRNEVFAEYDDLYLKEVPVPLGPKSIEHMLSVRNTARPEQGHDGR